MTLKQTMKTHNFGIFRLTMKTPEIWEKVMCVFKTKKQAENFWVRKNMGWSMRYPRHGLYIFKIVDGRRIGKPEQPEEPVATISFTVKK